MTRKRPSSLSDRDLRTVADSLVRVLPVAVLDVPDEPRTLEELLRAIGGTRKEQIRRGAIAISGANRGKEYLAARRSIERRTNIKGGKQRRGTTPKGLAAGIERLSKAIRRPDLPNDRGLSMALRAHAFYSDDPMRQMPAAGWVRIPADALGTVRSALRAGDETAAAMRLLAEFGMTYGITTSRSQTGDAFGGIETVQIRLEG